MPDDSKEGVLVEKVVYGDSAIFPEFAERAGRQAHGPDRHQAAGKDRDRGGRDEGRGREGAARADHHRRQARRPGEQVRCVVSVSMLTEGWDANNVTHILGVRAFGSQLLCEQVVGRGLRRMSYNVDPETGLLPPEYVDVYGIPFSLIPFKGKPKDEKTSRPSLPPHLLGRRSAPRSRFASPSSRATRTTCARAAFSATSTSCPSCTSRRSPRRCT